MTSNAALSYSQARATTSPVVQIYTNPELNTTAAC